VPARAGLTLGACGVRWGILGARGQTARRIIGWPAAESAGLAGAPGDVSLTAGPRRF
jgi:hypothetical protein